MAPAMAPAMVRVWTREIAAVMAPALALVVMMTTTMATTMMMLVREMAPAMAPAMALVMTMTTTMTTTMMMLVREMPPPKAPVMAPAMAPALAPVMLSWCKQQKLWLHRRQRQERWQGRCLVSWRQQGWWKKPSRLVRCRICWRVVMQVERKSRKQHMMRMIWLQSCELRVRRKRLWRWRSWQHCWMQQQRASLNWRQWRQRRRVVQPPQKLGLVMTMTTTMTTRMMMLVREMAPAMAPAME